MSIVIKYWYDRFDKKPSKPAKEKTMLVKTLLNHLEHFKSFVFESPTMEVIDGFKAQSKTDYQKSIWFQKPGISKNSLISYSWRFTRAVMRSPILLKSLILKEQFFQLTDGL